MRILLASSEVHPYSKTGGLADMVGALAKALARAGHQVGVVTPLYAGDPRAFPGAQATRFALGSSRWARAGLRGEIWSLEPMPGLTVYFVDQPEFYQRADAVQEDGRRLPGQRRAVHLLLQSRRALALHLPWQPEVVHVHDWQAGPAALLIHHHRKLAGQGTRTADLPDHPQPRLPGPFPAAQYALTNLPWDYFTPAAWSSTAR